VGEPIITDELAGPRVATIATEDEFFAGVRKAVKERKKGRRAEPFVSVSFQSVGALLAVLTPKRYALFEAVRSHGHFDSIEDLARTLGRDRATVSRDLKALAEAGLLQIREAVSPGHGKRTEIAPVARRLHVELVL
jgi:predicted transcriptional regulator